MPVRLPPLNSLKAFEAVARHLSVKNAAIELNVTSAAVSHQIRTLEDYLGVQLFRRYNRALELTDVAKAALPKLGEGFECLAQAVAHLRSHPGGGSLTVSAAPSFASRWLMPRLHRFIAAHPEIDVRISARMRRVSDSNAMCPDEATTPSVRSGNRHKQRLRSCSHTLKSGPKSKAGNPESNSVWSICLKGASSFGSLSGHTPHGGAAEPAAWRISLTALRAASFAASMVAKSVWVLT